MKENITDFKITIRPDTPAGSIIKDVWQYRHLFYFLAWRDILVRYKQTLAGVAWSVVKPLATMIVFTIVFGKLADLPSGKVPYGVMVLAALLPWQFFTNVLSSSGNSLVSNASLVSKVYFPRVIIPVTSVVVALVDFLVAFVLLIGMMLAFGVWPGMAILLLPGFMGIAVLFSLGTGLFVAALNVKYRDFMHLMPFFLQFGLYLSPVGYSSGIVPGHWRFFYSLNPMVGVIDGFRWVLLGQDALVYWPGVFISMVLSLVIFIFGLKFFIRNERDFADVI
ncbi:ABC transporter permease [uncultured Desulfobacter sp.]|uniref:ABC transporter permease n=1 Tax=uncultured Desulfobacter sp. TaxID=240139 RepID=UPI002AABB6EC|nr:ABC transporter permease [uncultured Desulfobacter sp.]